MFYENRSGDFENQTRDQRELTLDVCLSVFGSSGFSPSLMSEDEFDNLPDLFSGVTDAEWSRMLDAPGEFSSIRHPHGVSPSRSTVSTDYGDEHFVNPEALAEIDRIETSLSSFGSTASARRVGGWFSTPPLSMVS